MSTLVGQSLKHLSKLLRVYLGFAFIGIAIALIVSSGETLMRLGRFSTPDLLFAALMLSVGIVALVLLSIRTLPHILSALIRMAVLPPKLWGRLNHNVDVVRGKNDHAEATSTK